MAYDDTLFVGAEPWLRQTLREGLRVLLPLPVLALAWWFARMPLDGAAMLGVVVYALVNLGLLVAVNARVLQDSRRRALLIFISILIDALLTAYLLVYAGPLTIGVFPIYAVLVLKALRYRRYTLWTLSVPALLGPLYLSFLYARVRPTPFTAEDFLAYAGLVGGSAFFVAMLLALAEYRLWTARRLSQRLELAYAEHAERVAELESVNNDLRLRIRRQQALEEGLRAITGSLSLDEVLQQILDSLMQMLGPQRVRAVALTLLKDDGCVHRTLGGEGTLPSQWPEFLARRVVTSRASVIVNDARREPEWQELRQAAIAAALSVPLVDSDNRVLGALTVVSEQPHAFTATDARHLTSFSIQASVAIHNAELHTELMQQRLMLEAVLRDISDGLIVVNERGAVVMGNPAAYQALQHSDAHGGRLRETLDQLNHAVRHNPDGLVSQEVRVGEEDQERYYQVYGSLVRIDDRRDSLVAFALHDITSQKLQERQRVEFISMVSHELRNPLHTLTNFLKIVLQERTGPLNDQQREFLGLAAEQADALRGRIGELLEFNRLEAGRLRLQPHWTNLTDLILTTGARLQVQAEQFGLQLNVEVSDDLPETLMDSERIGQVITNLVENAIKATPAGGSITITGEVRDNEVWVHVTDTGRGIPRDQQEKIFSRFYRLEHANSKYGVHLGLGLAICKQIVEGHNGRIWVESEEGKGSRFTFALPLIQRKQVIGEALMP